MLNADTMIGVVCGGVVSSLVAYVFYRRSHIVSALECSFDPPTTIDLQPSVIEGKARDMLQATFADRRLTTLSIIRATLTNSGGKPLTQSDIEEPVSFAFREGVTVLDVDLVDKSPGVKPTRVSEASSLDWEFVSLNQGEHFTLQFLVDGHVRELPAVSGRILGIPENGVFT